MNTDMSNKMNDIVSHEKCEVIMYGSTLDVEFNNIKATSIQCAFGYIMYIDSEGNLWAMGSNMSGELGVGDTERRKMPTLVEGIKPKKISCNTLRACMIDQDNYVRMTGFNTTLSGVDPDYGSFLTTPVRIDRYISREGELVDSPIKSKDIACGTNHNLLIDIDDNLWTFGLGSQGQLGLGDSGDKRYPKQVQNFKVKQISCGTDHSIVIDMDDNVWAFGSIVYAFFDKFKLQQNETQSYNIPLLIKGIKAKQVASGKNYNLIIDMEDNVWGFGLNDTAQLGIRHTDTTLIPIKITHYFKDNKIYNTPIKALKVVCGSMVSLIIDEHYDVYVCGSNENKIFASDNENRLYIIPRHIPGIKAIDASISSWDHIVILGIRTN